MSSKIQAPAMLLRKCRSILLVPLERTRCKDKCVGYDDRNWESLRFSNPRR